jgi:hypothetical protein
VTAHSAAAGGPCPLLLFRFFLPTSQVLPNCSYYFVLLRASFGPSALRRLSFSGRKSVISWQDKYILLWSVG